MEAPPRNVSLASKLRSELIAQCASDTDYTSSNIYGMKSGSTSAPVKNVWAESIEAQKRVEAERKRIEDEREALIIALEKERKEREAKLEALHKDRVEKYQQYLESIPSVLTNKNRERLERLSTSEIRNREQILAWDQRFYAICKRLRLSDRVISFNHCVHKYLLPKGSPHIEAWKKEAEERVSERYRYMERWAEGIYGENWRESNYVKDAIQAERDAPITHSRGCRLCAKLIPLKKADWCFEHGEPDRSAFHNLEWILDREHFANYLLDSSDDEEQGPIGVPLGVHYRSEQVLGCLEAMYTFLYKEPNILSSAEFFDLVTAKDPVNVYERIMFRRHGSRANESQHSVHLPKEIAHSIGKGNAKVEEDKVEVPKVEEPKKEKIAHHELEILSTFPITYKGKAPSKAKAGVKSQAKPQAKTQAKPQAKPQVKPQAKPQAKTSSNPFAGLENQ